MQGHLCSEYHNVFRPDTQHGTVKLTTWQQLLPGVHRVAQIDIKLPDKTQAVTIQHCTQQTLCGAYIRPRKKPRYLNEFLSAFDWRSSSPGAPLFSSPLPEQKSSFVRLFHQAFPPGTFTVTLLEGTKSSVTQQHMYPLMKVHCLSP